MDIKLSKLKKGKKETPSEKKQTKSINKQLSPQKSPPQNAQSLREMLRRGISAFQISRIGDT